MFKKILNTKIKKVSTVIIILFLAFGLFKKTKALTAADIELLISIGLIPVERAESARDFLNSQKTSGTGSLLKTTTATSTYECLILNQNLIKGSSGTAVSALQKFLKAEGHFPKDQSITGYFGDMTVQAVSDFQLATGLISSSKAIGAGTIGPISRKKVQEVSCKKAAEAPVVVEAPVVAPVVVSTTTTTTKTTSKKIKPSEKSKTPVVSIDYFTRKSNVDYGDFEFRYEIKLEPKDEVEVFEIIIVCDPTAVEIKGRDINKCGEFVEYESTPRGTKSLSIKYKNISILRQPVIFAVTALGLDDKNLGSTEIRHLFTPAKPRIDISSDGTTGILSGSDLPENRLCNRQEQLEFIRHTMTPYDPLNPIYLPVCWPGDLMCNRAYPPTYCEIIDGPTSDDLCAEGLEFINGQCVIKN